MEKLIRDMNVSFAFYNAQIDDASVYRAFLEEDQTYIAGFTLPDAEANFRLLSEFDFIAFDDEQICRIREEKRSPFDRIYVIFYLQNGKYGWKIINGMAGKLMPELDRWLDRMQRI